MTGEPHFFEYLTRKELILGLCVAFATTTEDAKNSYPTRRYATPGCETDMDWVERLRRALRYLCLEHGLKLTGLSVHADGRMHAAAPVEPRNRQVAQVMELTGFPPPVDMWLPVAIKLAERMVPSLDREPLRAVYDALEREFARGISLTEPEVLREIARGEKELREATAEALLAQRTGGVN